MEISYAVCCAKLCQAELIIIAVRHLSFEAECCALPVSSIGFDSSTSAAEQQRLGITGSFAWVYAHSLTAKLRLGRLHGPRNHIRTPSEFGITMFSRAQMRCKWIRIPQMRWGQDPSGSPAHCSFPFLTLKPLTTITTRSPSTKRILCIEVVKLPMDFISVDHTAEVRSSTAGSLIKEVVQIDRCCR